MKTLPTECRERAYQRREAALCEGTKRARDTAYSAAMKRSITTTLKILMPRRLFLILVAG